MTDKIHINFEAFVKDVIKTTLKQSNEGIIESMKHMKNLRRSYTEQILKEYKLNTIAVLGRTNLKTEATHINLNTIGLALINKNNEEDYLKRICRVITHEHIHNLLFATEGYEATYMWDTISKKFRAYGSD